MLFSYLVWDVYISHGGRRPAQQPNATQPSLTTTPPHKKKQVAIKRSQCKLSRALPHQGTRHFWYHAEQRFLLLSTGAGGWDLRGYFLRCVRWSQFWGGLLGVGRLIHICQTLIWRVCVRVCVWID